MTYEPIPPTLKRMSELFLGIYEVGEKPIIYVCRVRRRGNGELEEEDEEFIGDRRYRQVKNGRFISLKEALEKLSTQAEDALERLAQQDSLETKAAAYG